MICGAVVSAGNVVLFEWVQLINENAMIADTEHNRILLMSFITASLAA